MKALLAAALLAGNPVAPAAPVDLSDRILSDDAQVPSGLAGVRLGWKVADFIAEHASKEDSEALGPDARGFRRFRVVASARPKALDEVVVYFRENEAMLVAATETRPIDDAGSWSRLVADLGSRFGASDATNIPPDRAKMLQSFALGSKGKSLKLREFVAWSTPTASVGALWLEDSWSKKRTYILAVSRTAAVEPAETATPAPARE